MSFIAGVKLTHADTTAQFALGTVFQSSDSKQYKYVLFNNGAGNVASVVGNFCYNYAVSGVSAGTTTTVTMDVTDSGGIGMGVFQAILADGEYGWIQIGGEATLTTSLTAGTDGDALTAIGTTDGTIDVSGAVTDYICATAVDASADIVLLTCPQ